MVPTGAFIPQMVQEGLLEELDLDKIPNFSNVDPLYANQSFDPGNKYSVPKDWGSTGWIYDNTVITTPIETWQDFIDVAMGPASGQHVHARRPAYQTGVYFWANGIDWNTENEEDSTRPRTSWSTSSPAHQGVRLLPWHRSHARQPRCHRWNGDARGLAVEDAGDDASSTRGGSAARRPSCGWTTGPS